VRLDDLVEAEHQLPVVDQDLRRADATQQVRPGITSFRQDGTAVATPVWVVTHDGRLYVWTGAQTGKVRRNPDVALAAKYRAQLYAIMLAGRTSRMLRRWPGQPGDRVYLELTLAAT
jgi:hypothetical protein